MGRLKDALKEAWELVQSRPTVKGQLRAFLVDDGRRTGARAAISHEGQFGLLIPIGRGDRRAIPRSLVRGAGGVLDADFSDYAEGPERHAFLGLWCREAALNEVFASFCESLLERWVQGSEPLTAAESCHAEFRHLLAGPKSPNRPALVGLLGELLFLVGLVERAPDRFDTWCADSGQRHDFRRGNHAVEVKTTLRAATSGQVVHISAIDQLEPPPGGDLYLHLVQLEEIAAGPVTVSSLITRLTGHLDGERMERLLARLARTGLPPDGASNAAFSVIGRSTYLVRDAFPRLTKSRLISEQLDVGVRSVEYDLDLSGCRGFLVDDDIAVESLLDGPVK